MPVRSIPSMLFHDQLRHTEVQRWLHQMLWQRIGIIADDHQEGVKLVSKARPHSEGSLGAHERAPDLVSGAGTSSPDLLLPISCRSLPFLTGNTRVIKLTSRSQSREETSPQLGEAGRTSSYPFSAGKYRPSPGTLGAGAIILLRRSPLESFGNKGRHEKP